VEMWFRLDGHSGSLPSSNEGSPRLRVSAGFPPAFPT